MKDQTATFLAIVLVLVLGFASTQPVLAQSFKHVKVKGSYSLIQVSAGGASTWALSSSGHPYIYKNKQFVLADSNFLCQIAVGGGTVAQPDAVWGLDCSGGIQKATLKGSAWTFSNVPGTLDHLAVGPGYHDSCHPYEVWGLNATSIYRYSYCTNSFDLVPGSLLSIVVSGSGGVWGINGNLDQFFFSFSDNAFLHVAGRTNILQLAITSDDQWYLLTSGDMCDAWTCYSGIGPTAQIQAGGNGVWAIDQGHNTLRFAWGLGLVPMANSLVSISVGGGGGVWGLDASGQPYVFSTP